MTVTSPAKAPSPPTASPDGALVAAPGGAPKRLTRKLMTRKRMTMFPPGVR
jgi:hypothetical protein